MAESSLVWAYLKPKLKRGWHERIESPATGGFPDLLIHLNGQTAFIELKYQAKVTERLGILQAQRNWHRRARENDLRSFVLVRIAKAMYLIPGHKIQEPFVDLPDVVQRSCFVTPIGNFDIEGLYYHLFFEDHQ